jgi:hypothetical protein
MIIEKKARRRLSSVNPKQVAKEEEYFSPETLTVFYPSI